MNKELFANILHSALIPSIQNLLPNAHRFMQDNDPKHTSKYAKKWIVDNRVNSMKTPAESPDFNPIENMWHELKEYIRCEVKPKVQQDLINGKVSIWNTVDKEKCAKYIGHLRKVLPKIIQVNGCATGF